MEGCLPPMGAPCGYGLHGFAYGPGQTDDLWGGAAFWGHRDSSRKRSWDEEDSSAESRAVRQCVAGGEGGGLSGAVWHGSPSAHGISGLSGHGAFQQHFQHAHLQHHQHPREQPPPVAQRSQQQNAFQVLMSASPIKVDGIVCNSCMTQEARQTAPCFHCSRKICRPCLRTCARCSEGFCSHCATVNYDGRFEYEVCIGCHMLG